MKKTILKSLSLTLLSSFFISCAGSLPDAEITRAIPAASLVTAKDTVNVTVKAAPGVTIPAEDKARFTKNLTAEINRQKASKSTTRRAKRFSTVVQFTQYDAGQAWARFMIAGAGKIELNANVNHYDSGRAVGSFRLGKAFAFGGVYGATTSVDDIETPIIERIARTVTGTEE